MTSVTLLAPCARRGSRPFQVRSLVVLAAALALAPTSLFAEAQVQGSSDAVRIETQNSSIEEVLAALGNAFDLRYRSSANLGKQLSGTYEGSLQRVVARLLEGYDFVLRNNKGKIEITVLGTRNAGPAPAVASATSNPSKAAPAPSAQAPAPVPSKATERPAPAVPPASPPSPTPTKVAEGPPPAIASPTAFAAPMPGPMPGPAPVPEMPGEAPVPVPMPSSGPAPFPEPMPIAVPVPMPQTNPGSMEVPMPGPAVAPTPANTAPTPANTAPAPANGASKNPAG